MWARLKHYSAKIPTEAYPLVTVVIAGISLAGASLFYNLTGRSKEVWIRKDKNPFLPRNADKKPIANKESIYY